MKIGERVLSEDEIEEKRRFEEQKRAFEDRASRLRSLSMNLRANENGDEIESVPAYMRKNMNIENPQASSDSFYSGYTVGMNGRQDGQAGIKTINTFLDGRKPD
jgi:cell division protein FtsZ